MERATIRWKKIRAANQQFNKIFSDKDKCFLIHYSCESFVDNNNGSLRVTSIAVRNLETAQTKSFSIFQYAEILKVPVEQINEKYSEIEHVLLNDFFEFLRANSNKNFVHWNMRDINFGFQAIEHRGKVLECDVFFLPETSKIDLARLLIQRYGVRYVSHPRLEKLIELNKITKINFLNGQGEADAFAKGEYLKLHQSTLRKVDSFENILERVEDGVLKVDSNFFEIYGLNLASIWLSIKRHWIFILLTILSSLGALVYNWGKLVKVFRDILGVLF